jgi:hypothetical protein
VAVAKRCRRHLRASNYCETAAAAAKRTTVQQLVPVGETEREHKLRDSDTGRCGPPHLSLSFDFSVSVSDRVGTAPRSPP